MTAVPAPELIGNEGQSKGEALYADSAYQTPAIKQKPEEVEMEGRIIEKAYRNKPLTEEMKAENKIKSKTRARVEHIYGFMYNSMNDGMFIRTIGKARAGVMIGLNNRVYNIYRYLQLVNYRVNCKWVCPGSKKGDKNQ